MAEIEEIHLPAGNLPPLERARDFVNEPAEVPHELPEDADVSPAPEMSAEEKEERRRLVRKIMRYRSLFPAELSDLDLELLGNRGLEELRDLGRDVEFLVSTRRSAKAVRGMFLGGMTALETTGPYLGLQIQGLANVCARSEELLETVDEAAVKYESLIEVDPVARIAIHIAQLCLALDGHNRSRAAAPAVPDTPAVSAGAPAPVVSSAESSAEKAPLNSAPAEFSDL